MIQQLAELDRDSLEGMLVDFAKNWLAHDGLWFQAVERAHDMEEAIRLDEEAWRRFAAAEARRLVGSSFGVDHGGGLEALERALSLRMYAVINRQHASWSDDGRTLRFEMDVCRVQQTRRRKGLPDFPCKSVGIVEFSTFATTVDDRIHTTCLHCPPEAPEGKYCAWEFTLQP